MCLPVQALQLGDLTVGAGREVKCSGIPDLRKIIRDDPLYFLQNLLF